MTEANTTQLNENIEINDGLSNPILRNFINNKVAARKHPMVKQSSGSDQFDSEAIEDYNLAEPATFDEFFYLVDAFNRGFRV